MINIFLSIANPLSERWGNVYFIGGSLTKYKSWEFQITKTPDIISLEIFLKIRGDHARFDTGLGLFGYTAHFLIVDDRHCEIK
jgi:hypothetical protein